MLVRILLENLDDKQPLSIFVNQPLNRSSTAIEVYKDRSQLNKTANEDQLPSYRQIQVLKEDPYEHTDQYQLPLAQTHQINVYTETKPSSEGYIQEPSIHTRSRHNSPL